MYVDVALPMPRHSHSHSIIRLGFVCAFAVKQGLFQRCGQVEDGVVQAQVSTRSSLTRQHSPVVLYLVL